MCLLQCHDDVFMVGKFLVDGIQLGATPGINRYRNRQVFAISAGTLAESLLPGVGCVSTYDAEHNRLDIVHSQPHSLNGKSARELQG